MGGYKLGFIGLRGACLRFRARSLQGHMSPNVNANARRLSASAVGPSQAASLKKCMNARSSLGTLGILYDVFSHHGFKRIP